ncbi:MAG: MerR family transcriptional regulator [Acidobacteriota bacterium]
MGTEISARIPDKLFFRIGEVCELIRVQPHVLRYWETEFPMLAPQKNPSGQRIYRRKDVEMVMRIRELLYDEKFTIAGAKKRLMEETRSASRPKPAAAEARAQETQSEPKIADDPPPQSASQVTSPEARLAIKVLKQNLDDLLTLLRSDVSIKN